MYMARVGEIFLKGLNRGLFVRQLYANLKKKGINNIVSYGNKFLVLDDNEEALKTTFGIANYSKIYESDLEHMNEDALELLDDNKTFRVRCTRTNKVYKTSQDIEKEIGSYIVEKKGLKVDLHEPEQVIHIDIFTDKVYLFNTKEEGLNGLPVGTEGAVYLDVKDEMKSTVAGFLMMKRGCKLIVSKDLLLLHLFSDIKIGKAKDVIVTCETLNSLELVKDDKFILRPLIGYNEKEIKKIYEKIIELNNYSTK